MKLRFLLVGLNVFLSLAICAQMRFSLSTGLSGIHNFSPQQQFTTFGQSIRSFFHFSPKQSAYAWFDYYAEGKFENDLTATAKSPSTVPQQINYLASSRMTYLELSLGLKHYFKGRFDGDKLNIYGTAGFGLLFARVRNVVPVDASLYNAVPQPGEGRFRKLTFDLAVGAEQPLGGPFYFFGDVRSWLPASTDSSAYLINQKNIPLTLGLCAGVRVLFGSYY